VFDDFLLDDIRALARHELVAEGYLRADVDAEIGAASNDDSKHIIVRIVPGTRFDDRRVVFSGQKQFSPEQLEADIMRAPGLADEMWDAPDTLRAAIERYYRSQGYLGVSVAVQDPVFTGESAALPVRIDEGPQFTIAGLDVIGVERRPVADVRRTFGVETGSPYQAGMLEPARRAVEADYLRNGYADVRVSVSALVDDERSRVDVVLRVDEGAQQVLADVAVEGAGITHASVIDRALDLEVGEPASVITSSTCGPACRWWT
jgi:outer membrane protein assembly factor BamA